jgi:hypothetical protein
LAGDLIAEVGDGHTFIEGYDSSSETECLKSSFIMMSFDDDGGMLVVLFEFVKEFDEVVKGFSIVH